MKTNLFISVIAIATILSGCNEIREKSAESLLKREKMRAEINDVIFDNREYTEAILNKMMEDSLGRKVLASNAPLIKMMCSPERIDSMMNVDREMMENMANILVNKMEADTFACSMMCGKVMASEQLKIYVAEHVCNAQRKIKK